MNSVVNASAAAEPTTATSTVAASRRSWRRILAWTFAPAAVTLVEWLVTLPGEVPVALAFTLFTFMTACAAVVAVGVGLWSQRRGLARFAVMFAALALLGHGARSTVNRLPRDWYLPVLVDARFALTPIAEGARYRDIIQGGALWGTGSWVRVTGHLTDGRVTVERRNDGHVLPPTLDWHHIETRGVARYHVDWDSLTHTGIIPRFSCPAYDGWYFVYWWDA